MAEQHRASKKVADENVDVMELEPVKEIEIETNKYPVADIPILIIKSSKINHPWPLYLSLLSFL